MRTGKKCVAPGTAAPNDIGRAAIAAPAQQAAQALHLAALIGA